MMILIPDDISLTQGRYAIAVLAAIAVTMIPAMILFSLQGGMMTAINIAYRATLMALSTLSGRISPDTTPTYVPIVHPGIAADIMP